MRVSLNWLQELTTIDQTPADLGEVLTRAGFEVEDVEDRRTWADGVVLGKILEATPHPNADKLQVCLVDIGADAPLNIVCGAANARADIYVAVATVGTYLPHVDLKIKKAKLRGVPSEGMICSLAELGLAKESAGIHIFDLESPQLGQDIRPLLGLDDVILDLTTTANRADALSMIGVAREVAALTGEQVQIPAIPAIEKSAVNTNLALHITEEEACPVYIGTMIEGVKIAPSPAWLQQRLQAGGIRPINNVVDVTNYIVLEWGQPLHAFDQEKLQQVGGVNNINLGVRFAQPAEKLTTLDGQERTLQEQNLLITVNNQPIALAGVMGGENTEVDEQTTNLVLEAAIFTSPVVRKSARVQGLRTEASTRYERGVNQAELTLACERAIALITEICGGQVTSQVIHNHIGDLSVSHRVGLRLERIHAILGQIKGETTAQFLSAETVENILTRLGCQLRRQNDPPNVFWQVTVPAYRQKDLEREIDLIEEVARLYGYDNFCETLPSQGVAGSLSASQAGLRKIRAAFRAAGLTELMHYSLVKSAEVDTYGRSNYQVSLSNPLFVEYSALRTELLTGLITAFQYNLENGNGPLNGVEIGRIFWQENNQLKETDAIAGIMGNGPKNWTQGGKEQSLSWFEAKGILNQVWENLGITVTYQPETQHPLLHPGRTASLWYGEKHLGTFGQLHPQVRQAKELPEAVYLFELVADVLLEAVMQRQSQPQQFQAYSTFPPADRDLAFFVPVDITVDALEKVMLATGGELLASVQLFDEYRGDSVPAGQRSLAFRLIYRGDRTLTDDQVEPIQQKVREALTANFPVTLRS